MRHLWLVAAAFTVSACDGVTTYGRVQSKSPIPENHLFIAAEKGAMVAQLRGNPFPISDARLSQIVRSHMHNALPGPDVRFVGAPGAGTVEPYKVVVAFNAPPGVHYRALCTYEPDPSVKGGTGTMTVSMGFCFGSDQISSTWGSVRGVTGPEDPKFGALVRQTAFTLVPMHRETPESGD